MYLAILQSPNVLFCGCLYTALFHHKMVAKNRIETELNQTELNKIRIITAIHCLSHTLYSFVSPSYLVA